uniref:Glycosyltransferase n=1 Tax=Oryza barthii TaxID=65489 RepID=A0A0D3GP14_9ORYZ
MAAISPASDGVGRRRRRVLMFPIPFQGHVTPMLQLADVLRSRPGLAVTVFHAPVNAGAAHRRRVLPRGVHGLPGALRQGRPPAAVARRPIHHL